MLGGLFQTDALLFTIPALLGTMVFLIRMGLMAIGGIGEGLDGAGDMDVAVDIDVDADVDLGAEVESGDSTHAFTLLSVQSVGAFLMGFVWGGLGGLLGFE